MTVNRAIAFLNAFKESYPDDEVEESVDMAVQAIRTLKVPVPVKPHYEGFFSIRKGGVCPICFSSVNYGANHCSFCGQLLEWSDKKNGS